MIYIIGLGFSEKEITLEADGIIRGAKLVIVKTEKYKAYKYFTKNNIAAITLDDLYCTVANYEDLDNEITKKILQLAEKESGNICYCVSGSAVGDKSVLALTKALALKVISYKIIAGVSYAERAIAKTLGYADAVNTASATDILSFRSFNVQRQCALVVTEIYDRYIASEVKLKLMNSYGEESDAYLVSGEKVLSTKLCDLDQLNGFTYDSTLVLPPQNLLLKECYNFNDLVDIVLRLRDPDGCQWDRAQTHTSIRANAVEEAYELVNAIEDDDLLNMIEESGDVLLQSVFHAVIGEGAGEFDYNEMLTNLCKKLITRHPHIFGQVIANNEVEALMSWEKAKNKEKKYETYTESVDAIAKALPQLTRSLKIQKTAKKSGFDWEKIDEVYDKILEEIEEVKTAKGEEIEMECGDLLFAVVNLTRWLNIDPEIALCAANKKFRNRFAQVEKMIIADNKTFDKYTTLELGELWKKAKKLYK